MTGLHLSMLGEVANHGVSHGPAGNAFSNLHAPPSIKICVQLLSPLLGLVVEGLVSWLLFLRRGLAQFLGGCVLLGAGLALLLLVGLDLLLSVGLCASLFMHAEDVAYTSEGVLDWSAALTLIAIGGCLVITQNLDVSLANLCILIFMGGILLLMGGFRFAAGFLAIVSDLGQGRA